MLFYLSEYIQEVGPSGSLRARPRGSDQLGWRAIDLRPDGGATLGGGGLNACLLAVPVANPDARLTLLAQDTRDTLGVATRNGLRSRLSLSGVTATRWDQVVGELLTQPPANGWKPVRRSVRTGQYSIYLGTKIWESSVLGAMDPSLPLLAALVAGRWHLSRRAALAALLTGMATVLWRPRPAHATVITEDWNCADSTDISCDLTWVEFSSTGLSISGNQLLIEQNAGVDDEARADSDLGTDDHYAQVTVTAWPAHVLTDAVGVLCRKDGTSTRTMYRFSCFAETGSDSRELVKFVSGTETALQTDATAIVANDVLYVEADGSTQEARVNGTPILTGTDTAITGNLRTGVHGMRGNASSITMDNFEAGDLAGGGGGSGGPVGYRNLLGVGQ